MRTHFFALIFATIPATTLHADNHPKSSEEKDEKQKWAVTDAPGPTFEHTITVDEGTWMNVDVSPDGQTIAFDLLGDIFTMPITGGTATPLATGVAWDMQPRFSPDGKRIAFTSDRSGGDNLWVMNADASGPVQLTDESFRLLNAPVWTPDGRFVVGRKHFTSSRSLGSGEMWMYHASGESKAGLQLTDRPTQQKDVNEPAFSPNGRYLYWCRDATPGATFQYNKDSNTQIYVIERLDLETGETTRVTGGPGGACRPTPSPDGESLAFIRRVRGQSVLYVRDLESGRERPVYDRMDRDNQEAWALHGVYPVIDWTPDSKSIVFWAKGKIRRVNVETGAAEIIPFEATATHKIQETVRFDVDVAPETNHTKMIRWASVSPSGDRVVYQALGKLYIKNLPGGEPKRLTREDSAYEFYPVWSPDGRRIAYTTWHDEDFGRVMLANADTGATRAIVDTPGHYVETTFSPDGETIAYRKAAGGYLRDGAWSEDTGLYTVPTRGGDPAHVTDSGSLPQFTPDSKRLAYLAVEPDGVGQKRMLRSVDLSGEDERTHLTSGEASEYRISPGGDWVAWREGFAVYTAPFVSTGRVVSVSPKATAYPARRLSKHSGEFLHWSADGDKLHWSLGSTLYTANVADFYETEDAEPITADDGVEIGFDFNQDIPDGTFALVGGRVITMRDGMDRDEIIENGVVVVEDNRITAVGSRDDVTIPRGARVFDVTGKTVMPGIVDVHAHGAMGTQGITPQHNWISLANLAFGVTATHDPSNDTATFFAADELMRAGHNRAPRLFGTGRIIYGAKAPAFYSDVQSYEDAYFHVQRTQAAGATAIKSYNQPRRDQRQMLIEACRKLGMNNVPEGGSTFYHNMTMLLDGHTGIEHNLPVETVYDDVLQLFAATEAGDTPTLVVCYGGITSDWYWLAHTDVYEDQRLARFVPRFVIDPLTRRRDIAPTSEYNHIRASESLKKLYDAGVPIHVGGHGQMAGLAAHWEIWSFVQGGMTTHEALKCATILGAEHVGFSNDLGSIEKGKLADLIVLDEDPLEDIRNTTSVRYTILNGRVYDSATMDQVFPDADDLVTTHIQNRTDRGWGWDFSGPPLTIDHGSCRGCGHPSMATHLVEPEQR